MVLDAPTIEGKIRTEETNPRAGSSRVENQLNQLKPIPRDMANAVTKNDCEVTYQDKRLAMSPNSDRISSRIIWHSNDGERSDMVPH